MDDRAGLGEDGAVIERAAAHMKSMREDCERLEASLMNVRDTLAEIGDLGARVSPVVAPTSEGLALLRSIERQMRRVWSS